MPQYSDDLFLGSAKTGMGTGRTATSSTFTGTISGTVLTVTNLLSGDPLTVGMVVDGAGVTEGSIITSMGTASGGVGTYNLNVSSTVSVAVTMVGANNEAFEDPSLMPLGVGPLGRIYVWDVVPAPTADNNISPVTSYTTVRSAPLAAGTAVTAVRTPSGAVIMQLDCPRNVTITAGSGTLADTAVTVNGLDYYGQPMSEVIQTGTTAGATVAGNKAFYQIVSVTLPSNPGVTLSIGTGSKLGMPIRVTDLGYVSSISWAGVLGNDTATAVVADTATATATSGDVRGTVAPSTAPDGVKRLVAGILVPGIACGPNSTRRGALGVDQYSAI